MLNQTNQLQNRIDTGFVPIGLDMPYRVFISEDPIRFWGGINFFAYVGNNPVNYVDPEGLHRYCGPPFYNCYYHLRCIYNHEHRNQDINESPCWFGDPPIEIPPWVCDMGVKAGCNLLCKRLGGSIKDCMLVCTAAAELVCPDECE